MVVLLNVIDIVIAKVGGRAAHYRFTGGRDPKIVFLENPKISGGENRILQRKFLVAKFAFFFSKILILKMVLFVDSEYLFEN